MDTKPNCYECLYRGEVPGSAHSYCNHPSLKKQLDNPLGQMMAIFASVGRASPVQGTDNGAIVVTAHPVGVQRGWFNHPWNFDPTWLLTCTGFKSKIDVTEAK